MSQWLKPSLKIRTANAIFWISLDVFRDYGLENILFRNNTFLFFKIENQNFQHLFEIEFCETSQNFNSFRQSLFSFFYWLFDWVEILWGFMKFLFKQMLKVSAFYLEKQKSFIPKKIFVVFCSFFSCSLSVVHRDRQWQSSRAGQENIQYN